MKKIIILDFETGEVHISDFDSNIYNELEIYDFFEKLNGMKDTDLSENNCQWMIVDKLQLFIE